MSKANNIHDIITTVLSGWTLGISTGDLSNILNVVLLVFSIINIFIMCVFRIYNIVKNKGVNNDSVKEVSDVLEDTKGQLEDLANETKTNSNGK